MAKPNVMEAIVRNGRLVLDEATELPEGQVVRLIPADYDDLDDEERTQLHESLERAWQQEQAGEGRPAEEFLKTL